MTDCLACHAYTIAADKSLPRYVYYIILPSCHMYIELGNIHVYTGLGHTILVRIVVVWCKFGLPLINQARFA